MSRPANPYDNASCESFIKTLKREEIYANEYENLEHLRSNIEEFIERYYNQKRLHSALGYRSPEEFEAQPAGKADDDARCYSEILSRNRGKKSSTELSGEGTQTPSLPPDPNPARRINEMSFRAERCSKCTTARLFQVKGSLRKSTASVATENCLNGGVHPTQL